VQLSRTESGNSQIVGVLFLVAIAMLLALLILLIFQLPAFTLEPPGEPPEIFQITAIRHTDRPPGVPPNYDSRIILMHTGEDAVENDLLEARIYRDGTLLSCRIITMNGHHFISTPHIGVQTMSGSGCQTGWWKPGERIALDLTDGTIHPGDVMKVDIIASPDGEIISRDQVVA
jgi:hypothetical protein